MSISDVKVVINLTTPVREQGFGFPLILESGATATKNYAEYNSLAAIVEAGYENTSEVYKLANIIFMQENAPDKIAICSTNGTALAWLQDELNVNKEWRQLLLTDEETYSEVANYIETLQGKILFISENDYEKPLALKRTVCFAGEGACAAVIGESAGRKVGSFTYKNLIVKGVEVTEVTSEALEAAEEINANLIVKKAGDIVTSDGITTSGEYIDIVDSEDYIIQQITYRTQKLLNNVAKVPYSNNGISMLESVVFGVLQECYNNGMIATNEDGSPAFSVEFKKRADVNDTDVASRKYIGGQFKFKLAGAIHKVEITGEIEL